MFKNICIFFTVLTLSLGALEFAHACSDPTVSILLKSKNAFTKNKLRVFNNHKISDVIDLIERDYPSTTCLYNSIMNEYINESLRVHSQNVEKQFVDQSRFYDLINIAKELNVDIYPLFSFTLALHDIGKPIDKEIYGNAEHQTAYNRPLFLLILSHYGFAENELKLVDALVSHDDFGSYFQKKLSLDELEKIVKARAKVSGVSNLQAFVQLQLLYYISDATAHKWILENFFVADEDGLLWPKEKQLLIDLLTRFGISPKK